MRIELEQRLYRIDRTAGKILNGAVYGMLILALLAGVKVAVGKLGVQWSEFAIWSWLLSAYHYAWIFSGGVAAACVICRICLSPFVKSEEQELFEEKVDYVLQQKQKQQLVTTDDYSPFCNLDAKQEDTIIALLRDLPENPHKPGTINLALIARHLTALEQLHKMNLSDRYNLRLWVMKISNKKVPNSSQFNEAIPSTNRREVAQLRTRLEQLINSPHDR